MNIMYSTDLFSPPLWPQSLTDSEAPSQLTSPYASVQSLSMGGSQPVKSLYWMDHDKDTYGGRGGERPATKWIASKPVLSSWFHPLESRIIKIMIQDKKKTNLCFYRPSLSLTHTLTLYLSLSRSVWPLIDKMMSSTNTLGHSEDFSVDSLDDTCMLLSLSLSTLLNE